jgi:hypothetical protein
MSMNRIIGTLFSGFACKGYAIAMAIYIASQAAEALQKVNDQVAPYL